MSIKILDQPIFEPHDLRLYAWCHGCGEVEKEFITVELRDGLHIVLCVNCIFDMGVEIAERFAPADSPA